MAAKLADFDSVFACCEDIESVIDFPVVRLVKEELKAYLRGQATVAYHCTKEPAHGYFQTYGLRLTNLKAHQDEFLALFGQHFSALETEAMRSIWERHFVAGSRLRTETA